MAHHDVLVVGGGTGNNVAAAAADAGKDTALVEKGPLGGTCLNRGCNPSKMLIQAASAADQVRDASRFHVDATLGGVDVAAVVEEMETLLGGIAEDMAARYREREHLTMYRDEARFVDEKTVEVAGETVSGETVVLAAGSRPLVPPIDGLDEVAYLTSRDALALRDPPERLAILGGGYIACELGYAFDALGTDVTVIEMLDSLVPREDSDVAAAYTDIASERHEVYTGHRVTAVEPDGDGVRVHAETESGDDLGVSADEVLVALGRTPNTDALDVGAAGIETDENGYVETDEYLRTTAPGVYAQGDIAGNWAFKHSGDYETGVVVDNAVHGVERPVDYSAMPHAIFTEPQMAGVGATEDELADADREYVVGRAALPDTAMGRAKKLEHGFVKVLAAPNGELLGCHALGHEASVLIHEAVVAMRGGDGHVDDVAGVIHAHPTLAKVNQAAFRDARRKVTSQ